MMEIKVIVQLNKESRKLRYYDFLDFPSIFASWKLKAVVKFVVSLL